jgi:hypothetical protein
MKLFEPINKYITVNDIEYELDLSFDNVLMLFDEYDRKDLTEAEKVFSLCPLLFVDEPPLFDTIDDVYALFNTIITDYIGEKKDDEEDDVPEGMDYLGDDIDGNPIYMPKPGEGDEDEDWSPDSVGDTIFDFDIDAELIYASFMKDYGINLFKEQGKLQWSEFNALLANLSEETPLRQVIRIRTWRPDKDTKPKEKKDMRKLQRKYRITKKS